MHIFQPRTLEERYLFITHNFHENPYIFHTKTDSRNMPSDMTEFSCKTRYSSKFTRETGLTLIDFFQVFRRESEYTKSFDKFIGIANF